MALVYVSGPAVEPVSVAEAKDYLRLDGDIEDALVASLVLTSRLHVEAALGLALVTQSWRLILDRWPESGAQRLPIRPVQSVSEIRILSAEGQPAILDPAGYALDGAAAAPRLLSLSGAWSQPGQSRLGIEIDIIAGFGASPDDVPAPLRQAIKLLVAHWYENREIVEIGAAATRVPDQVSELLSVWRERRL